MDGAVGGAAASGGGRWSGGTGGGGVGAVIVGGPIIIMFGGAAMFGTDHCGVVMNGCAGDVAPGPIIIMGFIMGGGAMGIGIAGCGQGARKPGQPAATY